jgi:hypothetical protein
VKKERRNTQFFVERLQCLVQTVLRPSAAKSEDF